MKRLVSFSISMLILWTAGLVLAQVATPLAVSTPVFHKWMIAGNHPLIKKVVVRIREQQKRIYLGQKDNTLTKDQADVLRAKMDAVREQMKADVQQNGKMDLTQTQYQQLNQMLDSTSTAIGRGPTGGSDSMTTVPSNATPTNQ